MNAPWKSGSAGTRDPFSAYICDDLSLDVVRSVCDDMGWAQEKANKGGLRNAERCLDRTRLAGQIEIFTACGELDVFHAALGCSQRAQRCGQAKLCRCGIATQGKVNAVDEGCNLAAFERQTRSRIDGRGASRGTPGCRCAAVVRRDDLQVLEFLPSP